jgi:hypothetical protein
MRRPSVGYQFEALQQGVATLPGVDLFVDTVGGRSGNTGLSWDRALSTVEGACDRLDNPKFFSSEFARNARIWIIGDVREQFTAPLGVYGVKVIGASNGRPRHSTSGGVVVDGNGTSWRQSSSAEGRSLIAIHEQGWEFENILFVPESGYSAVNLRRAEDATDPDASHAVFRNCKFTGPTAAVGYALEDVGGAYHILVEDCEFVTLEYAWKQTSVGVAAPSAHVWRRNRFTGNKIDIAMNALGCVFEDNKFQTPYNVTTHPTTLNLASTADAGLAANKNLVIGNYFADIAADVTIAKGYKPATGDVWRNKVTNTAADIVAVPA